MEGMLRLACWRVRDTGLAPAPPRFRRLGGVTRHHGGEGEAWPANVVLVLTGGELVVRATDTAGGGDAGSDDGSDDIGGDAGVGGTVGRWPVGEVEAQQVSAGPPVTFVIRVPGSSQLLAASAGPEVGALLEALTPDA